MNAAKEAFSEYLDENSLDSRQIYFVNQIVEYIVDIFTDLNVWMGIRIVIDQINANAAAA